MAEPRTYNGNGHTAMVADPQRTTRQRCLALACCGAPMGLHQAVSVLGACTTCSK